MRKAQVLINELKVGIFEQLGNNKYRFTYYPNYEGHPVSLTMPVTHKIYDFDAFPAFFEGLLPEGYMLEALLRKYKIDSKDYFGQLIKVGQDVVGAVTIEEFE